MFAATGGSSPLARGAPGVFRGDQVRDGIIPARAGSTMVDGLLQAATGDHPRSRGEHFAEVAETGKPQGSSPLARGAPDSTTSPRLRRRIIPARAGSTSGTPAGTVSTTDHPRSRGEHVSWNFRTTNEQGSSPLARGALASQVDVLREFGIIPARAGSTLNDRDVKGIHKDHPRSRGEHYVV